jgi:hypothetical protein
MVKLFNQEWSKAELLSRVGQMEQLAGIRLVEAGEGKARGCRLLDVWTGSGLRFQVNADRALDFCYCEFQGLPLAWRSPAGDVHPSYYEPEGLGWLRTFSGGLLTTCGLDQFGLPSEDGGKAYGLHGRVSNLPATQVNHRAYWNGDEYQLQISGEIRQAALFAENLVLRRIISTSLGSNRIRIDDVVTNEGFERSPHMLLYHFNLGFPLVSESTCLHLTSDETLARDEVALPGLPDWNRFQAPTPGYQEQVFIHRPSSDQAGRTTIELHNPKVGIGLRWQYATDTLPYLMEWKMMGEGAYVVGIEPANCDGLGGRAATRAKGALPMLEPGESRAYHITLEVIGFEAKKEAGR